jgi:hypothetical protein
VTVKRRARVTKDRFYSKEKMRGRALGITKEVAEQLKRYRVTERTPREK